MAPVSRHLPGTWGLPPPKSLRVRPDLARLARFPSGLRQFGIVVQAVRQDDEIMAAPSAHLLQDRGQPLAEYRPGQNLGMAVCGEDLPGQGGVRLRLPSRASSSRHNGAVRSSGQPRRAAVSGLARATSAGSSRSSRRRVPPSAVRYSPNSPANTSAFPWPLQLRPVQQRQYPDRVPDRAGLQVWHHAQDRMPGQYRGQPGPCLAGRAPGRDGGELRCEPGQDIGARRGIDHDAEQLRQVFRRTTVRP